MIIEYTDHYGVVKSNDYVYCVYGSYNRLAVGLVSIGDKVYQYNPVDLIKLDKNLQTKRAIKAVVAWMVVHNKVTRPVMIEVSIGLISVKQSKLFPHLKWKI